MYRRSILTAGAAALGSFTLSDLLRAEAAAGIRSSSKALINVHLDGGPPHIDLTDPKPQAPVEIRGEFRPIPTVLPGVQVSELLPKLAAIADRLVLVRSLVGSAGTHNAFQCHSGFDENSLRSMGGRPALGCVVSKLRGSTSDPAPSFVDLMQGRPLVRDSARPGFLGPAYRPFRFDLSRMFQRKLQPNMLKELESRRADHAVELSLIEGLSQVRIQDRSLLLSHLDGLRRELDNNGMMSAMDAFNQQAIGILTSGRLADALDLSREDPRIVDRYRLAEAVPEPHEFSDQATATNKFLLCRRLIEAGVRCVSVSISDFDTHADNFPRLKRLAPIVDHGLATLVTDLEECGLLNDVTIVVWGEFGRTPVIDAKSGGRHHWPQVGMCLLAGGGMRVGQVIGATDRIGGEAVTRPIHYQDILATLYHNLGVDPHSTITDLSGRPQYLIERGKIIHEVA